MELMDRYLAHIGRLLPAQKRADILAELRDELDSRIDDQKHDMGRPLEEADVAEIIRVFGSPRTVAARYAEQPYLISPGLLPAYWAVIRALAIASIVLLIAGAAAKAIAFERASMYFDFMSAHWGLPILAFGFVTIGFVLYDRFGVHETADWGPQRLRPLEETGAVSRWTSLLEFAVNVSFIVALLLFVSHWAWTHGPVWHPVYQAMLGSFAINALAVTITLLSPRRGEVRLAGLVLANIVSVVGLAVALYAAGSDDMLLRLTLAVPLMFFVIMAGFAAFKLALRLNWLTA